MLHQVPEIPDYTILEPLGSGTSGHVWLAKDKYGERRAIKVTHFDYVGDADYKRRFKREVTAQQELYRVSSHVARIFDSDADHIPPYIVMDYINGTDLNRLLAMKDIRQYGLKTRLHWIEALASTLTKAHSMRIDGDTHGLIHRDIKPQNIRIQGERPYLLDFSISLTSDVEVDSTQDAMTLRYAAPELSASEASDIFSFGLVTFEILYEVHPMTLFEEASRIPLNEYNTYVLDKLLTRTWRYPTSIEAPFEILNKSEVKRQMNVIFENVFALEPLARYETPKQFSDDLLATLAGLITLPVPTYSRKPITERPNMTLRLDSVEILSDDDSTGKGDSADSPPLTGKTTIRFDNDTLSDKNEGPAVESDTVSSPLENTTLRFNDDKSPQVSPKSWNEKNLSQLTPIITEQDLEKAEDGGITALDSASDTTASDTARFGDDDQATRPFEPITEIEADEADEVAQESEEAVVAEETKTAEPQPTVKTQPQSVRPAVQESSRSQTLYGILFGAMFVIGLVLIGGQIGGQSAQVLTQEPIDLTPTAPVAGADATLDTTADSDLNITPIALAVSGSEPSATDIDSTLSKAPTLARTARATRTLVITETEEEAVVITDTSTPTTTRTLTPTVSATQTSTATNTASPSPQVTLTASQTPTTAITPTPMNWEAQTQTIDINSTTIDIHVVFAPKGCIISFVDEYQCTDRDIWIDHDPVSNAAYESCVRVGECGRPAFGELYDPVGASANKPVVGVNKRLAEQYCKWRKSRLPTEIEWQFLISGMPEQSWDVGEWIQNSDTTLETAHVFSINDRQIITTVREDTYLGEDVSFRCVKRA